MDSTSQQILGLYRAEFDAAKRDAKLAGLSDWGAACVAIGALFVGHGPALYALAVGSVLFGGSAVYFRLHSDSKKSSAEKGRRAVVLAHGLGKPIEGKELSDLLTSFTVPADKGAKWADPDYYDSKDEPGPGRLAGMVQESAFWSRCLYEHSAKMSWLFFSLFSLVSVGFLFAIVAVPSTEWRMKLAQVSCLIVSLLLARDHVGRALSYSSASREANSIDDRIEGLLKGGARIEDVLLAVGDYNCAVESTPLVGSGLYHRKREELSRIWGERRASARGVQTSEHATSGTGEECIDEPKRPVKDGTERLRRP